MTLALSLISLIMGSMIRDTVASSYRKHLPILNWIVVTFFCVFQFYLQVSASLMVKLWMHDFNISPLGVSSLSSAFFYTYLLMQIPVGFLNDRFNPRWILTLGAFLVAVGCLLLAETSRFELAFLARMMMGIGSSFGFVSMLYISAQWFKPEKFTLMVSSAETLGMMGVAITAVVSAGLISWMGWRLTLFYSGLVALVTMVMAYAIVRSKPLKLVKNSPSYSVWKSIRQVLSEKTVWLSGLFGFLNFSIVNAVCSLWGVPFLRNVYHFSLSLSAALISMIFYGMALGSPLVAYVSMKTNRRKPILLIASLSGAVILSLAIFIPNLPVSLLFVLFFLAGFCSSSYIQCYAISKESTPRAIHGVSMAMTNMLVMLGAPFYQVSIAALLESHFFGFSQTTALTYRLAMGLIPLSFVISFVLAFFIKETYCLSYKGREG